jgi:hypothetical protein
VTDGPKVILPSGRTLIVHRLRGWDRVRLTAAARSKAKFPGAVRRAVRACLPGATDAELATLGPSANLGVLAIAGGGGRELEAMLAAHAPEALVYIGGGEVAS